MAPPVPRNLLCSSISPASGAGPLCRLTAPRWRAILDLLAETGAHLTVAVTATWVRTTTLTPYARRFPMRRPRSARLERGAGRDRQPWSDALSVRDGAFRPRAFGSNRPFHREFYEFVPPDEQRAQHRPRPGPLADAFKTDVVTFVPPGNLLQPTTLELARDVGLRFASFRAPTSLDGPLPVIGDDRGVVFHDREVARQGPRWLRGVLSARRGVEVLQVKELGARLLHAAAGRSA